MTTRKTKAHWEKFCEAWNSKNPIGTAVKLAKDGGEVVETKTRSAAYVCDSGYPVIFLEGVRGYYLLDRIANIT